MPVAYSLIREVQEIATSGKIHLGSDERQSLSSCFAEVKEDKPDFDSFESKLSYLLEFDGLTSDQIVRWSNEEGIEYPGSLGSTVQCRQGDCRGEDNKNWIATVDIQTSGAYGIYNSARELALRKPWAIIAETGNVDSASMIQYHMSKRMLAFAMGVSDLKDWSRGMFEEAFTDLCIALYGNNTGCAEFAVADEGIREASSREALNRKLMCEERTQNITRHVYRPEFQEKVISVF